MSESTKLLTVDLLANLLHVPTSRLVALARRHGVIEQRERSICWWGLLLCCVSAMLRGGFRHRDRQTLYAQLFGTFVSTNAFSDRLSQISPRFFKELLRVIVQSIRLEKRLPAGFLGLIATDATCFRVSRKARGSLSKIPGQTHCGLKLYLSLDLDGQIGAVKLRKATQPDVKIDDKPRLPSIELKDRAWFSMPLFAKRISNGRYFISRIQKKFNPKITEVLIGSQVHQGERLQNLDLRTESEVAFIVKPYRGRDTVYRLNNRELMTLHLKGKKIKGEWYWYIAHIPRAEHLSFDDVHSIYRARWEIEELFREIKSSFGGDRIRLSQSNCIANHIYLMLISWLISRNVVSEIAKKVRRKAEGARLDTVMTGVEREMIAELADALASRDQTEKRRAFAKWSRSMQEIFSRLRARSGRKSQRGKAIGRMRWA